MRVLITRPQQDASGWVKGFTAAGHEAVPLPLIAIGPLAQSADVEKAWNQLADYAAVMFVSGNAVTQFFASKPPLAPVFSAFADIKTRAWATGPGTVNALQKAGVQAIHIDAPAPDAAQFDSEALWTVVKPRVTRGTRVLIVRGADGAADGGAGGGPLAAVGDGVGRDWLATQLTQAGVAVNYSVAYQRSAPVFTSQQRKIARAAAKNGSVWVFSSSQALAHLAAWLPDQNWAKARAVVTHERIAALALRLGFGVVCESRPALADLVASIESMP